jgi:PIN domain nuclease of toxin-antitoxin system
LADAVALDSSAILCLLYQEAGSLAVSQAMADPGQMIVVSSVNLCEVATKLALGGATAKQTATSIGPFLRYVVDFDSEQALVAAELARSTRPLGLSLGDRACLALASTRRATAWTTDTTWPKLKLDIKIRVLRGR